MLKQFIPVTSGVLTQVAAWEPRLSSLPAKVISQRSNSQGRTIRQIIGHMVDSATNNIHRAVHLQYQDSPFTFPNYATNGNNDRWIAIQNYQDEDWTILMQLWKYTNLHFVHVVENIQEGKLDQEWVSAPGKTVRLEEMVVDYLRHFELHLVEIEALIGQ